MAKETVKVKDNQEVKLVKSDEMKKKTKQNDNKKMPKNSEAKSTVREEMKKVTWPTKKMVAKYSLVTIIMLIFLALFFLGLSTLFDLIYRLVQGWM